MTAHAQQRRWYDKDPLLSMAMKTLEESSDEKQIRLAMHLVKIISEHNIDAAMAAQSAGQGEGEGGSTASEVGNTRWYDLDKTLKTSVEMLRCCQADTQKSIAREMAQLLRESVSESDGAEDKT